MRNGVAVIGPNIMEKFILHFACERKCLEITRINLTRSTELAHLSQTIVLSNQLSELNDAIVAHMPGDINHLDRSWTTCLLGKVNETIARCMEMSRDESEAQMKHAIGIAYLRQSEKLGNPLAMIFLADLNDQSRTPEEKLRRLNEAHNRGYLEGTFLLAEHYWLVLQGERRHRISQNPKPLRRSAELLLQAAKGGHAEVLYY